MLQLLLQQLAFVSLEHFQFSVLLCRLLELQLQLLSMETYQQLSLP